MSQTVHTKTKQAKWPYLAAGALLLLAAGVFAWFWFSAAPQAQFGQPTLTVQTPQKISRSQTEEFVLDVTVSGLGEAIYPAASMSIDFDPSCLEFLGVEEGNVFITADGSGRQLPQWSCNTQNCNATGKINIMYLDMSGGKNAFRQNLLAEDDNVVLRLAFRLRGSVRTGDVYALTVEDAVFAASDEAQSLAMTRGTLNVRDGKIVIGE